MCAFSLERRYVNSRGHKLSTQLDYAQKRKNFVNLGHAISFPILDPLNQILNLPLSSQSLSAL